MTAEKDYGFSRVDRLVEVEEDLDGFTNAFQGEPTEVIHRRVNLGERLASGVERCSRIDWMERVLQRRRHSSAVEGSIEQRV